MSEHIEFELPPLPAGAVNKRFVNEVPMLIAQHSDEPESTLYDINCTIGTNEVTMWRGLVKEAVLDRLIKDVNVGMYGGTAMVTVTRVIGESVVAMGR